MTYIITYEFNDLSMELQVIGKTTTYAEASVRCLVEPSITSKNMTAFCYNKLKYKLQQQHHQDNFFSDLFISKAAYLPERVLLLRE